MSKWVARVKQLQTDIAWLRAEITTTEHSLRSARDEAYKQRSRLSLDLRAIELRFRLGLPVRRPRP